ncbi:MAG: hypothetical protein J6U21_03490 [Bacteroidales bacterium]|nr:hypothetical protein [Bacteroidales bacterium]
MTHLLTVKITRFAALFFLLMTVFHTLSVAQVRFGKYFHDRTLRLSYTISGDSTCCKADFEAWHVLGHWAGARRGLDVCNDKSSMEVVIREKSTRRVIYHKSFSSLFCEWQSMNFDEPSGDFNEGVMIPFPKRPSVVSIIRNYGAGHADTLFNVSVGLPKPPLHDCERPEYEVVTLHAAITRRCIDIVFLPEGYTENEMDKFLEATKKMTKGLFEYEPFSHHFKSISISAVLAPSPESGIDIPSEGIERETLMDFSYDTFGIERYIGTRNYWAVSRLASNTRWDHAIILVNSDRYGGGGIFNYYSVFPGGNPQVTELFIHEFGHAFANLPDEYEEPGNPIVPNRESDRDCIMKTLDTHFYCDECKAKVESVIRGR